jgi:parvulin-like peptidyl-prolyl isomerase
MKRILLATALLLAAVYAYAADPLFADKVVAKGKGIEVKQSEVDEVMIALRASLAAQGQALPDTDRARMMTNALDRIVMTRLVSNRATAEEKAQAKKKAEEFVADVKKKMPSEEAFKRRLEANGMKYETFFNKAEEETLVRLVVEREISAKIIVTDAEVQKFYEDNAKSFDQPELVKVNHILLATLESGTKTELPEEKKKEKRALIEKLLKRAKDGEDFAKLAKEYSEDIGSKDRGGEYIFPRGRMVPEFEAAAFALMPGQISDVVTTAYGYHIIKLQEKIAPKKLTLAEVAPRIKDGLITQQVQKQLPDYYKKLRDEAGVQFSLEAQP